MNQNLSLRSIFNACLAAALVLLFIVPVRAQPAAHSHSVSGNGSQPKLVNPEPNTPFPYNHFVSTGIQDKSGVLWFATSEGVYSYDGKQFTNYKTMDGLGVEHVTETMKDADGNIWLGARGGMVRCSAFSSAGNTPSFYAISIPIATSYQLLQAGDSLRPVSHMLAGGNGDAWFCAGYNIYRTDGSSKEALKTSLGAYFKSEKMQMSGGDPDDFGINSLCEDDHGNLLISLTACSCCYDLTYCLSRRSFNDPCITGRCGHNLNNPADLVTHNNTIASSLTKVTLEDGHTNIAFTTAHIDKAGNLLLGTAGSGLYGYDGRHFVRQPGNGLPYKCTISTIFEDSKGDIWIGTGPGSDFHGKGVFRYSKPAGGKKMGTITHFSTADGLCAGHPFSNDVINIIAEDNAGRIWFGGDAGVCYYDPAAHKPGAKQFVNLTQKEGMTDDHPAFILKDRSGDIWFGTWNLGLYKYHGHTLTKFTE